MQLRIFVLAAVVVTGCGSEGSGPGTRSDPPPTENLDCLYVQKTTADNPQPESSIFADCAARENGDIRVAPEHLAAMDYDADGMATILVAEQWYYIRADGGKMPVVTWDNWADDYAEGLARTVQDGKIAYADRAFEVAVPPRYDWGWPFEQGRALVCLGCRQEKRPGEEHTSVVGGAWGYVDRTGNEVVPVAYSREQAYDELVRRLGQPRARARKDPGQRLNRSG